MTKDIGPTNLYLTGHYCEGDAEITKETISVDSCIEEGNRINVRGLKPNTKYNVLYTLYGPVIGTVHKSEIVTTKSLHIDKTKVISPSSTSAQLYAPTNIDIEEVSAGFQWRKFDAPESLPSNEGNAIVYDGILEGQIKNLQSTSYYNVRAFYKSADGTYYYGDWVTFDPSDFSYFEPTVRTYTNPEISQNTVTLSGNILGGSDPVISQGFEYWNNTPLTRGTGDVVKVLADGQLMKASITDLLAGEYSYRAFAETEKGFYYGSEQGFTIEASENDGVSDVPVDDNELVIIGYYNLNGVKQVKPAKGFNVVLYSNGETKKIFVK